MTAKNKKRTILITGGAGFIGSHLADRLLQRGHKVSAFDNLSNGSLDNLKPASASPDFKFIKADALNFRDCLRSLKGADIVYHLACLGVRHSIYSPLENHRVNAEGTLNILEAARINKVKKVFYISTSEVYGGIKSFPIRENALPAPLTVYGASKLAGEYYTNVYRRAYGIDTAVLRVFNNYGPRAHYEGDAGELIPRAIVNILYGKPPVIFGDGSNSRDFIYVSDTARALADLTDAQPQVTGMTLNVGARREFTIKQAVELILSLMGKKELGIKFIGPRPQDVPRLYADTGKFYRVTKFRPEYTFEKGLLETIRYYRDLSRGRNLLAKVKITNWQ